MRLWTQSFKKFNHNDPSSVLTHCSVFSFKIFTELTVYTWDNTDGTGATEKPRHESQIIINLDDG